MNVCQRIRSSGVHKADEVNRHLTSLHKPVCCSRHVAISNVGAPTPQSMPGSLANTPSFRENQDGLIRRLRIDELAVDQQALDRGVASGGDCGHHLDPRALGGLDRAPLALRNEIAFQPIGDTQATAA